MDKTQQPAEVFPFREFVRDEMVERGWSDSDLASSCGMTVEDVVEAIDGPGRPSRRTLTALAGAFGVSPELFFRLDSRR